MITIEFFFFKFQAHRYLKLKQSKDCFISYLFISLSAGPVIYPSQIAAARNSFLHFSIDLGASIIYAYKLSQQQILCKHVATLQLVQKSPRIHQTDAKFEPAHWTSLRSQKLNTNNIQPLKLILEVNIRRSIRATLRK